MSKMHLYPVPEQNALDVFAHLDPLAGRQRARPRAWTGKRGLQQHDGTMLVEDQ